MWRCWIISSRISVGSVWRLGAFGTAIDETVARPVGVIFGVDIRLGDIGVGRATKGEIE